MNSLTAAIGRLWIVLILALQLVLGLYRIGEPFTDGRIYYNWSPPFWIEIARVTNGVGFLRARFGAASSVSADDGSVGFYASHPQLIGPVVALWTRAAGYSEISIRLLGLFLTMTATALLWYAIRALADQRTAIRFVAIWPFLPLIYVYGRKIDQEPLVMIFLAMTIWGFARARERMDSGRPARGWPSLFAAGILGMCLSDWSGLIFGALFVVAALRPKLSFPGKLSFCLSSRRLACTALAVTIAGLVIVVAQDVLQAPGTPAEIAARFWRLYRYRAGLTGDVSWLEWLRSQWNYFDENFTLPLFGAGIAGLLLAWRRRDTRTAAAVTAIVLAGQLVWLAAVHQASALHLYFQWYLTIPVSLGVVWLLREAESAARTPRARMSAAGALMSAVFLWNLRSGVAKYNSLLNNQFGTRGDIDLIRSLRAYPAGEQIYFIGASGGWFENPNIRYYGGHAVRQLGLGEIPMLPPVFLSFRRHQDLILSRTNTGPLGEWGRTDVVSCSDSFCLFEREEFSPAP